jgi:hypothetical protein
MGVNVLYIQEANSTQSPDDVADELNEKYGDMEDIKDDALFDWCAPFKNGCTPSFEEVLAWPEDSKPYYIFYVESATGFPRIDYVNVESSWDNAKDLLRAFNKNNRRVIFLKARG